MSHTTDGLEAAYARFIQLMAEVEGYEEPIESEAASRFKIINRMHTEVLGWEYDQISPEEPAGEGFADYALAIDGINRLIVEAKRGESDFQLHRRPCGASYKLSGPVMVDKELKTGIQQAITYSA